jgi:transposase-like protein
MNQRDEAQVAAPPTHCPSCRSRDLTTTSKAVDKNTYWRCVACGEVWNLGRRQSTRSQNFPTYGGFNPSPERRHR